MVQPGKTIRVLDVGCSDGRFLDLMKTAFGENIETYGIDFEEKAISLAAGNGHKVQLGRIEDTDYPPEHFNVIYISHVIEHLSSPRKFAVQASRLLAAGACFMLRHPISTAPRPG